MSPSGRSRTIRAVADPAVVADAQPSGAPPRPAWAARTARPTDPLVAAVLAWAFPGAGHAFLARRRKALLVGGAVAATYLAGLAVGGLDTVSATREPIWFIGQAFGGLLTLLTVAVSSPPHPVPPSAGLEAGTLYTCVASLLNFMLVLDAAGTAAKDLKPPKEESPTPGGEPGRPVEGRVEGAVPIP